MITMLWVTNLFLLLAIAVAFFLGVVEVGFRIGTRHRSRLDEGANTHVGALQGALLGLLALLLGFTFAMGVSRFDNRRSILVDEANAIGTTYLRAQFLPDPHGQKARVLLRSYVDARVEFYNAGIDKERIIALNDAALRMNRELWQTADDAAALDQRSVITGLFIDSLNDIIDLSEQRLASIENHVPEAVVLLLLGVTAGALGFIGYARGLNGHRRLGSILMFTLLIAMVLGVILDIDRPRRGFIQVGQDSMLRLQASMEASMEAPP
jgi:hypothetical protein